MSRAPYVLVLAAGTASVASAQVDEERLQLMRETSSYTDVPDAADGEDPFDAYLRIGFSQRRTSGNIRREANAASGIPGFERIGAYSATRNVLEIGAEIGVYHDLALTFRLPVILSDTYSINPDAAYASADVMGDAIVGTTRTPEPLFNLGTFDAPTRSGIDTIHMGVAWSPLNQNRVHEVPSWVILADFGIPVGTRMRACNPGDAAAGSCDPGISRGNFVSRLETRISRRHHYAEPYFGLGAQIELPTRSRDAFRPQGKLPGYQQILPPIIGELNIGVYFIPWENLPKFQRLSIDARFTAAYVSNGHDYSPLYDLLGTSYANHLRTIPNCDDGYPISLANAGTPSVDCPAPHEVIPFNGLTDTQAYGRFGGRLALDVQAARYVTFSLGVGFTYQMAHSITSADICNADVDASGMGVRPGAVLCVSGIFNPHFRSIIDEPGQRFELAGSNVVDLFARATAMF